MNLISWMMPAVPLTANLIKRWTEKTTLCFLQCLKVHLSIMALSCTSQTTRTRLCIRGEFVDISDMREKMLLLTRPETFFFRYVSVAEESTKTRSCNLLQERYLRDLTKDCIFQPSPNVLIHDYDRDLLPLPSPDDVNVYRNYIERGKTGKTSINADDMFLYRSWVNTYQSATPGF